MPALDGTSGRWAMEMACPLGGAARLIQAREVIAATGALERPFPIPGWTLPGVMTAGAAQIALKSSGLVPDGTGRRRRLRPTALPADGAAAGGGGEHRPPFLTQPREPTGRKRCASSPISSIALSRQGAEAPVGSTPTLRIVSGVDRDAGVRGRAHDGSNLPLRGKEEACVRSPPAPPRASSPNINLSNATWLRPRLGRGSARLDALASTNGSSAPCRACRIAGDGAGIGGAESAPLRGRMAAIAAATRLGLIGARRTRP